MGEWWKTPRGRTAMHEASHAMAALYYGLTATPCIEPDGTGYCTYGDTAVELSPGVHGRIALAGVLASAFVWHGPVEELTLSMIDSDSHDWLVVQAAFDSDEQFHAAFQEVVGLVSLNWHGITDLARQLLEHGEIAVKEAA